MSTRLARCVCKASARPCKSDPHCSTEAQKRHGTQQQYVHLIERLQSVSDERSVDSLHHPHHLQQRGKQCRHVHAKSTAVACALSTRPQSEQACAFGSIGLLPAPHQRPSRPLPAACMSAVWQHHTPENPHATADLRTCLSPAATLTPTNDRVAGSLTRHTSPCSCSLQALKGLSCLLKAACRESIWMRLMGTVREMLMCRGRDCWSAVASSADCSCAGAVCAGAPAAAGAAAVAFVDQGKVGQRCRALALLSAVAADTLDSRSSASACSCACGGSSTAGRYERQARQLASSVQDCSLLCAAAACSCTDL